MPANDKDLRQSYLSMIDVLCETFDIELYDYQREILLERFIFETRISKIEDSYRRKECLGKTCDLMIHDELS